MDLIAKPGTLPCSRVGTGMDGGSEHPEKEDGLYMAQGGQH